jgi:outer membrane receptor protein involved in Fe transport
MTTNNAGSTGNTRAVLLVGACGLALSFSAQAYAQQDQPVGDTAQPATDAPAPAELTGNEIIVTATKREQTLQDVPVAVSVTSAQTIERAQIRDLKDLSTVVPSLRVNQLQSSANTNFIIRGFGNGANNAGIEPSVGVFVDGVYRSRSAAQIGDFPDVQRIEVLRGPQSTLFGKNASVGVISIVTKAPQFDFGGNVEASYGNYNAVVLKGVVTGPISKTLAVSLGGGYNRRDGIVDDLGTGHKTNDRNRWFVRGQALWEPTAELRVRIIGDYGKINENCCAAINLKPSGATTAIRLIGGNVNTVQDRFANKVYNNFDSTNDIENYGLSGQADYDLGPLTLTSITAYRRSNAVTNQDSDFTSADLLGRNFQDLRIKTFTQELRVATNLDGPLNFLLGGFYFNEDIDQHNQASEGRDFRKYANILLGGTPGTDNAVLNLEGTLGALSGQNYFGKFFTNGSGLTEAYRLKNEAFSIFGQADFKVGDRLTITGGINYTKDKKRYSANVTTSDVFSQVDVTALRNVATNVGIAQTVGQFLGLPTGTLANAAQIGAFAGAQPAAFAQIQAGAAAATAPLLATRALQILPQFLNLPNVVEPGRTSDDKFTYVARAAFDANDHINLYASYATGFKASSINLSRDSRPLASDAAALTAAGLTRVNQTYGTRTAGPENSTVYEIGLKADWGVVQVNIAAFDEKIKGFQSNIFTGTGFVLSNAGAESVRGIEFEGTAKPAKGVTLTMAVTYLDPKYDDFKQSAVGDISGSRPAGIPAISATWGAQVDHAFPNEDHLIARTDFHYESQSSIQEGLPGFLAGGTAAAVAAARPFTREVSELSASLTYAMHNGIEMTVWGRNITNNRYLLNIFDSVAQTGSISGYVNQPRTYGVSARYRF